MIDSIKYTSRMVTCTLALAHLFCSVALPVPECDVRLDSVLSAMDMHAQREPMPWIITARGLALPGAVSPWTVHPCSKCVQSVCALCKHSSQSRIQGSRATGEPSSWQASSLQNTIDVESKAIRIPSLYVRLLYYGVCEIMQCS